MQTNGAVGREAAVKEDKVSDQGSDSKKEKPTESQSEKEDRDSDREQDGKQNKEMKQSSKNYNAAHRQRGESSTGNQLKDSMPRSQSSLSCGKTSGGGFILQDRKEQTRIATPHHVCALKDTEEVELKFPVPGKPGNYHNISEFPKQIKASILHGFGSD